MAMNWHGKVWIGLALSGKKAWNGVNREHQRENRLLGKTVLDDANMKNLRIVEVRKVVTL